MKRLLMARAFSCFFSFFPFAGINDFPKVLPPAGSLRGHPYFPSFISP